MSTLGNPKLESFITAKHMDHFDRYDKDANPKEDSEETHIFFLT
jgi:hypothetical protein